MTPLCVTLQKLEHLLLPFPIMIAWIKTPLAAEMAVLGTSDECDRLGVEPATARPRFVPSPGLPCVVSAVPAEVSIEDRTSPWRGV